MVWTLRGGAITPEQIEALEEFCGENSITMEELLTRIEESVRMEQLKKALMEEAGMTQENLATIDKAYDEIWGAKKKPK